MFRLTRVGDVMVPLSVSVQVNREGAFFSGTPPTVVMFEAGSAVAMLVVGTQDDDLDEPDGAVRVAIAESEAYALSESASATVLITDNDDVPDVVIAGCAWCGGRWRDGFQGDIGGGQWSCGDGGLGDGGWDGEGG